MRGNAWFFAGENGPGAGELPRGRTSHALRSTVAREYRVPARQPHRRLSLVGYARGQSGRCVDAVSARGRRCCGVGLFVLAYLLAWMLFVAARLLGWRVRRAAWMVLVAVALVPLASVAQSGFQPADGVVIEGHGRATRSWLRLRSGLRAAPAQGDRILLAGDAVRAGCASGCPTPRKGWLRESDLYGSALVGTALCICGARPTSRKSSHSWKVIDCIYAPNGRLPSARRTET